MTLSVTIKTLQQKQFQVEVDETDTVGALKSKIEAEHGHLASSQKLIYAGKILTDDKVVKDLGIKEKDFLVRVLGSSVDDLIGWFEGEDMFASATRHGREAVVRGEKVAVCG